MRSNNNYYLGGSVSCSFWGRHVGALLFLGLVIGGDGGHVTIVLAAAVNVLIEDASLPEAYFVILFAWNRLWSYFFASLDIPNLRLDVCQQNINILITFYRRKSRLLGLNYQFKVSECCQKYIFFLLETILHGKYREIERNSTFVGPGNAVHLSFRG